MGPSLPSEISCGHKTVRWLFIIFNVIFSVVAVILVGVGSYGVGKAKTMDFVELLETLPENIQTQDNVEGVRTGLVAAAAFVIVVGLVTLFISSCGWVGACKENKCLLFTFSVTMAVLVFIEFIIGIVVVVGAHKLSKLDDETSQDWVEQIMTASEAVMNQTKSSITIAWEVAQSEGECCGINGSGDWEDPPPSCKTTSGEVYQDGCFEVYKDLVMSVGKAVGAVAITFCIIQIFGVIISCYLACTMSKSSHYEQH